MIKLANNLMKLAETQVLPPGTIAGYVAQQNIINEKNEALANALMGIEEEEEEILETASNPETKQDSNSWLSNLLPFLLNAVSVPTKPLK